MMNNFWRDLPEPFFVLAPMEAVTDVVFRHVVKSAAAPDLYFTEFTNATGWVHAGDKAIGGRMYRTSDETNVVAQIWGGEPGDMEKMAAHCRDLGFIGIDINMGCPAKSAVKSGGSALIRDPELAARSIEAAKTAGLPVSVKTRLGYSSIEEWRDWLTHLLRQDIAALTIHLRSKKEMSKVPAHHELIPEIVALRDELSPHTPLIINGDIETRAHGLELIEKYPGVNGIMIGRGVFHNPFAFEHEPQEHGKEELLDLLRLQLDLYDTYSGELGRPFDTLKRFFKIYIRDYDGASGLRAALMQTSSTAQARELLDNHTKSVSGVDKTEVGTYTSTMTGSIKAIVFDSDGTLLDTRHFIFEGYKAVLEKHGLSHLANDHYIRQRLGKPTVETFEQIIAGHDTHLTSRELADELDAQQNTMLEHIQPYPKLLELLEKWRADGVKLCLFSSGYGFMIDRNFAAAGIPNVREIFDAIITADDGLAHKPEPDAIHELLRRVDVPAGQAIVVGDHAYDIIAAKRAQVGLKIGVLHGVGTRHELLTAGADFLCDSLESLDHLITFADR